MASLVSADASNGLRPERDGAPVRQTIIPGRSWRSRKGNLRVPLLVLLEDRVSLDHAPIFHPRLSRVSASPALVASPW